MWESMRNTVPLLKKTKKQKTLHYRWSVGVGHLFSVRKLDSTDLSEGGQGPLVDCRLLRQFSVVSLQAFDPLSSLLQPLHLLHKKTHLPLQAGHADIAAV